MTATDIEVEIVRLPGRRVELRHAGQTLRTIRDNGYAEYYATIEETGETTELETTGANVDQILLFLDDQWHLVDCYDLDLHIRNHMPVFQQIADINTRLNADSFPPDGDNYNQVLELLRPWLPQRNDP